MVVGDIIRLALLNAGVASIAETIYADDMYVGLSHLSAMLAQWQRRRWLVWALTETAVVSNGAASYTIGLASPSGTITTGGLFPTDPTGLPPGTVWSDGGVLAIIPGAAPIWPPSVPSTITPGNGTFAVARPDRIDSAFARLLTNPGPNTFDYPLAVIDSREDYNQLTLKNLSTFPAAVFYESASPTGLLHFWPVPPAAQFELHIFTKAPLQSVSNLTDPLSAPPEYTDAMIYGLAVRLCMAYAMPVRPDLQNAAGAALNTLRMANAQMPTLQLPLGLLNRQRGMSLGRFLGGGW